MRAFILCDYEGTTSTVTWDEETTLGPEAMAGDVNAVIRGLREGGFTRFVVRDYHGGGRTIHPADIDPAATLIRGKRSPFPYGLSSSFDAMVFVGAHSKAGTANGVMSHTMCGDVFDLRINGESMGEIGGYALLAGHFGVPIILVAGDQAACDEAAKVIPDLELAPVKVGLSRFCATCLHPMAARALIHDHALAAARRLKDFKPVKREGPFVLEVTYKNPENADRSHEVIGGERADDLTVRIQGDTVPDVLAMFERSFE